MKYLIASTTLFLAGLLGACSPFPDYERSAAKPAENVPAVQQIAAVNETLLLVSLADGSVIMQTINSDADICFKQNGEAATTCYIQGEPIIDPATQTVIGYETLQTHIELIASSRH